MLLSLFYTLVGCAQASVLDLKVKRSVGGGDDRLLRRDETQSWDLESAKTYYSVSMAIGSEDTELDFLLDTGSSDFFVNGNSSASSAYFDYTESSTFRKNDSMPKFSIGFGDGSKASGFWGTDEVIVFNHSLNATFAVATENSVPSTQILGLGLRQGESTVHGVDSEGVLFPTYVNFPLLLKEEGLIDRVAYSIWLDGAADDNGSLLFGGVDHSKYDGELTLLPIVNDHSIPQAGNPTTLSVTLNAGTFTNSSSNFSEVIDVPVLLDTGTTICRLPANFTDSLGSALNGQYNSDLEVYEVDCNSSGTVTFDFSGKEVAVDLSDLLISTAALGGANDGSCALGIYRANAGKYVLGDGFLRNVYTVFDLEALEIGLAPAAANPGPANIESITSGIPNATRAPFYR